jgi:hypothetical protein
MRRPRGYASFDEPGQEYHPDEALSQPDAFHERNRVAENACVMPFFPHVHVCGGAEWKHGSTHGDSVKSSKRLGPNVEGTAMYGKAKNQVLK